jgi:hypothetical protein
MIRDISNVVNHSGGALFCIIVYSPPGYHLVASTRGTNSSGTIGSGATKTAGCITPTRLGFQANTGLGAGGATNLVSILEAL